MGWSDSLACGESMKDRFLRRSEIAELFNASSTVAAEFLARKGVHPIDLGRGRGKGPRWLESAVMAALPAIHTAAQPKPKKQRTPKPPAGLTKHVQDMTPNELAEFLKAHPYKRDPQILTPCQTTQ